VSDENVVTTPKIPLVDFSYQFNMAREKVERKIFSYLCDITTKLHAKDERLGILVVLGTFGNSPHHVIEGMRRLGNDTLQKYINVMFNQSKEDIMKIFEDGSDGAIIIDASGHVLANKVYLIVENPSLEIPEGAGTRHISAASFSCREDVIATFTLSEESRHVRMWKDGAFMDHFDPGQTEVE
jgi:DNA integrity scanning protein DisA with diadenylate cyclase activity